MQAGRALECPQRSLQLAWVVDKTHTCVFVHDDLHRVYEHVNLVLLCASAFFRHSEGKSVRPHRCRPRATHFYEVASFPSPHTSRMQSITRPDVLPMPGPPCARYNPPPSGCACLCSSCEGGNKRWSIYASHKQHLVPHATRFYETASQLYIRAHK